MNPSTKHLSALDDVIYRLEWDVEHTPSDEEKLVQGIKISLLREIRDMIDHRRKKVIQ